MINRERMELFAAALESDRFHQCKGTLRTVARTWEGVQVRHCALGVMTQVALDNGLAEQTAACVFFEGGGLDPLVADWYGLPVPRDTKDFAGMLERINPTLSLDLNGQPETIAGFNDDGTSFWDIAQLVRAKWLKDDSDG